MKDSIEVLGVVGAATAITLSDVQTILAICSWALAIAFTLWKWRRSIKKPDGE